MNIIQHEEFNEAVVETLNSALNGDESLSDDDIRLQLIALRNRARLNLTAIALQKRQMRTRVGLSNRVAVTEYVASTLANDIAEEKEAHIEGRLNEHVAEPMRGILNSIFDAGKR